MHHQAGSIRLRNRKSGQVWEFLWRDQTPDGKGVRHTRVIGTLKQYPTKESASAAIDHIRRFINQSHYRTRHSKSVSVGELLTQFTETQLQKSKSKSAQLHLNAIETWIKPKWGVVMIVDVVAIDVERWLKDLCGTIGEELSTEIKKQIRTTMRLAFDYAIKRQYLAEDKNPIMLVRVQEGADSMYSTHDLDQESRLIS